MKLFSDKVALGSLLLLLRPRGSCPSNDEEEDDDAEGGAATFGWFSFCSFGGMFVCFS